jgi:hypothetical protein
MLLVHWSDAIVASDIPAMSHKRVSVMGWSASCRTALAAATPIRQASVWPHCIPWRTIYQRLLSEGRSGAIENFDWDDNTVNHTWWADEGITWRELTREYPLVFEEQE